ncbi:MAG: DUF3575 domain-containing protein [Bacteroidaceae bacterium]|nr:DUF3575 domain-containing protein [Bacteroidaceae bacterium]
MTGKKRIIITIIACIFAFATSIQAQTPNYGAYHQLEDFPFVFVSDEIVTTPPTINDSVFDAAACGIRFEVNKTELLEDDPFIAMFREKLAPWLKTQNMELRHLFVKGAASPEGPYDNNVRLSCERTDRLIEFLNEEMGENTAQRPVDSKCITEDYGLLVKKMKEAGDADYERVNRVWLACEGDEACCKSRLMALDNGRLWNRLKQEYFPALRQARVILWFARKNAPEKLEPTMMTFSHLWMPDSLNLFEPEPIAYTRRHLIAARTNLVHDLLYVPQFGWAYGANIQLEYYPLHGHYTYNLGFTFTNHRHWSDYKFFQIRDLQLEVRRYFRGGGVHKGLYMGVYGEATKYGIGFSKTKGWQGEGGGGGLSVGYTCALNRKGNLRLELSASLGFFYTRYDPYVYGNPITGEEDTYYYYDYLGNTSDFKERNHQFKWIGPTNAGIHITYDIIYRKKQPVNKYQQEGGGR